ncbi:MAG: translation initiation factor IF-2, partial [Planctomycetaceae bacterium]
MVAACDAEAARGQTGIVEGNRILKNIRIFALARDLGLESKELIDYATQAGVQVKDSALASITPEERDVVMQFLETARSSGGPGSGPAVPPTRERVPEVSGKLREIKAMPAAPRPRPAAERMRPAGHTAVAGAQTATVDVDVADEATDEDLPAAAEREDYLPDEAAETETEAAVTARTGTATVEPGSEPGSGTDSDGETPAAAEAETRPEDGGPSSDAETRDAAPISRDDYVSAAGISRRSIREMEMKPRGTIMDSEARRQRARQKSALPNIAAAPEFKAPVAKRPKVEERAQKPDVKLTPGILEQGPLTRHMKKAIETKEHDRKKGKGKGKPAEIDLLKLAQQEEIQRQKPPARRRRQRAPGEEAGAAPAIEGRFRPTQRRRKKRSGPVVYQSQAVVALPLTIRSLSEAMGRPANDLIRILFQKGRMVRINDNISEETALELALELGVDLEIKHGRDIESELLEAVEAPEPDEADLEARPPVVTILGHVDHGKTSLLDKHRSANVAAGEAGGITQHNAAYQVQRDGHKITFVDTPGHAAFGEMRARGANVTDIVVLVVAADDGVMPQTVECISHARNAGVPMIVAMNKIDKPEANPQRVLQELAAQEVLPAEWGGDTEVVRTSAVTGEGLDDLLETVLVTAELQEFKANPDRPAIGVCLEAFRHEHRGVLAWLIVQKGTLRIGDVVLCGEAYGRIRSMYNDRDEEITQAVSSMPIKVSGLDIVPGAGDHYLVMGDIEEARQAAEDRRHRGRTLVLA